MATHGSLTKAGKVRGQTPKVEGRKIVGTSSSVRNKSNSRNDLFWADFLVKQTWTKKKETIVIFC